ncbi:hypothetical protein FDUTEX481_01910 [Tolypothrix sp. PCC 7601]|nr:hypothetical protein FDUTEX481_01910 [Tolypothrix sp. PCC 7601]BAY91250.1 hypothetical protein NIES3275_32730 [Microchaete diplosiphon NIES-3275]
MQIGNIDNSSDLGMDSEARFAPQTVIEKLSNQLQLEQPL